MDNWAAPSVGQTFGDVCVCVVGFFFLPLQDSALPNTRRNFYTTFRKPYLYIYLNTYPSYFIHTYT
ncbi:hypothetical protein GGR58DRAFT_400614 [Xylaria digitata]|nr:hypothetical protein GGR58DRAFT_400614 [Xylaria digitata]